MLLNVRVGHTKLESFWLDQGIRAIYAYYVLTLRYDYAQTLYNQKWNRASKQKLVGLKTHLILI